MVISINYLPVYVVVCYDLFQNGGSNLCSVDDSNDHVLSVWDWQREEKLAEVKVLCEKMYSVLNI